MAAERTKWVAKNRASRRPAEVQMDVICEGTPSFQRTELLRYARERTIRCTAQTAVLSATRSLARKVASDCFEVNRSLPLIYSHGSSGHPVPGVLAQKRCQPTDELHVLCPKPVSIVRVCLATWRTTASAVQAADVPTLLRRIAAALTRRLSRRTASGRVSEPLNRVYRVTVTFHAQTSPRC